MVWPGAVWRRCGGLFDAEADGVAGHGRPRAVAELSLGGGVQRGQRCIDLGGAAVEQRPRTTDAVRQADQPAGVDRALAMALHLAGEAEQPAGPDLVDVLRLRPRRAARLDAEPRASRAAG